ncbi:hypothetical protein ABK040_003648 [Willaertia magna]
MLKRLSLLSSKASLISSSNCSIITQTTSRIFYSKNIIALDNTQQQPKKNDSKVLSEKQKKEDEELEYIIEEAYIRKKLEALEENERLRLVVGSTKARQKKRAYLLVGFGLLSSLVITIFVLAIHNQRNPNSVQTESSRDRPF